MNLFWSTRILTGAREDHLTEFIAAALEYCQSFRSDYTALILADFAKKRGWPEPEVLEIATQVTFPDSTCCPDMVLTLKDGHVVVCEHKLDALETAGPERDPRAQLNRYLDLPIDGLVYVRSDWKPPASEVLEHEKYVRPVGYAHFLWRDFFPLLASGDHLLLDWLRDGFERLGFTPPHAGVGEMDGTDASENARNRTNFAKLWGPVRSESCRLGWNVGSGSIVELYLSENSFSTASDVFISPMKVARFLVRVTPRRGNVEEVERRLRNVVASLPVRTEIVVAMVPRKYGRVQVVNVVSTLREVLGDDAMDPPNMERKLLDYVTPLLQALQAE